ncbi:MAG: cation transporter [Bacteroidetes bacterium]|jgi:copper chaperone CopZ|nr:cation transporter [Bacteroidota bacterium]MBK7139554.1 cation transporter [Bacteroidota bacterium]MBK8672474.1 cation transporter [Bacteroidota bacterium]MBP7257482.1 cation transporter [Chitinophagales bacterium]MBP9135632.1 cation transporter [Chitinophagales bacterium]
MKNLFLILMLTIATITAKAQDNNTIETNATCKAGQDRITTELKKLDGVFDVVFSGDGTITLDYSSDGTTYDDLVEKITECGFTANGIEPKNGDKNLCKTEKKTK